MNMKSTIGLAALALTGCSRFSGCFSKPEETAQEQAHLVAAYLVTKGVHYENVYGMNYNTDGTELTIMYQPEGNAGDYADDQLITAFESPTGFSVLYFDIGLDGTPDLVSDVKNASPVIPLELYSPEDQQVHVDCYRFILSALEAIIQESGDVEALKKVEPL